MAFYPLEKLHCLDEGYRKAFNVAGHQLLLLQTQGQHYLLENRCPHAGHPLLESRLQNGNLQCPLHGIRFSLQDGRAVNATEYSGEKCLQFFKVVYHDNLIGVDL